MSVIKSDTDRGFSMSNMYSYLGSSRQEHAQMVRRNKARMERNELVLSEARKVRMKYSWLGSRRLYYTAGITAVGITQFEQIMSGAGLTVQRLRRRIITTDSSGKKHLYPNLLLSGYIITDINEVVVCDLTYYRVSEVYYYILLMTDVYSQRLVGAVAAEDKRSVHALEALKQLVDLRGAESLECTIHHSDRGSEYRSDSYIGALNRLKMQISMAGNCIENGYAERRNGTIKNEFLLYTEMSINNICQLRKALKMAVHRYNYEIVQAKLRYQTPVMYEAWIASLAPDKRPRKPLYDFTQKKQK